MPGSRRFSFPSKFSRFFERGFYATVTVILLLPILVTSASASNNPVPFVDIVSPVSITPGATGVTLTVRGTGFVGTSTVVWNGTALTTTFVSNKELTAVVPDAFVAAVGLGSVVVVSPTPGGGKSDATFIPVAAHESATSFPSTPSSSVTVGNTPQGIVTADFNGDGKLDLAVANSGDSTVSILLGNGDGTFTTKSTPAAGSVANWIAVGDFNEDGKLDIAVANSGSTGPGGVSILLGNGDGTFALHSSPTTGDGPFALVAGDFNGDGHLDLAVSNTNDGTVTILLGTGTGTFTNGGTLTAGGDPDQMVAGDFNEDGNLDLAVTNDLDGTISVFLGNGSGGFAAQSVHSTGGSVQPLGLIAADFNGDGHLDLAAVNLNDVAIFLGDGTGAFTLHANFNPTGDTSTVLIAGVTGDYNGDGILDLVVSDMQGGQAFLLPGTGGGNFGTATTYTTAAGAFGVVTADFNGDGGLDLAIANGNASNVTIFLQQLPVTLSPSSLAFGNQNVSTSSASQPVTLTNHTGGTLSFTSISITGADSGEFSQTHNCGAILTNFNSCTIQVTFSPTAGGLATATLTIVDSATNSPQTLALTGTGVAPSSPPSITKSFNPATVAVSAPSTVTFSITNGNGAAIDASFTDTLASGLVVAPTPAVTNACGGTVTATAGASSISFTNATFAVGTCAITVNVQSATDGVYSNSVTIDSTAAGNGNTSTVSLTVINPPTIAKVFGAATVPLNGTTSLTFTVSSGNTSLSANGIAFTDTLPAGLVSATPTSLVSTCSGTATSTSGSSSVSLTGSSLAGGASCTVSLNVTGTTLGVKPNSVQVSSTNAGTGNTSNASVTVTGPPVIIKAFGAATIPLNGATSLSFTIQNNNTTQSLSSVAFTDTLPAGLAISTPNGLTGTCGGGTITATQGTGSIGLTGATLAASSSCNFSVNVTGFSAGAQNNTTGAVTSTEGGTGGTASASVAVVAPPSIAKAFNPTTIALNATTTLTFTVSNPAANTVAETAVAFSDTLPTGLVVATPNGLTNNCGGTAVATAGSTSITLTGGGLGVPSGVCTVHVNVTGTTSGLYTNTSGAVTSTNGGTGNTASANLTVTIPPAITKAFGAATIPLNGTTSLTFTVTNPNAGVAFTGVAFTDNLPAGLVIATPNNLSSTCGGSSTAVAGSSQASLTGGTLAASGSCTVSLNVQGASAGAKNNSVQVSSAEGGTGNTSNASVTVTTPAVILKAFGAASIPLNGSTSLSFTIQNNNTVQSLSGVAFTDTLPAGLAIPTPNGLTGACGGGTITATQGTNVISLSGATLAASSSCNFTVNVTGFLPGAQNNTTGAVTSTEGGPGGTASASVAVVAPPSIAKAFGAAAIPLNGTTSLTFTLTNPAANTLAETAAAFSDTLPAGIVVATPNGLTNTCGGTVTATAGSGTASLTGASIAVGTSCTVHINVTGTASGQFTNTTGTVSSTNGGTGNTATANLTVASPPTITKVFGAATIPSNGTTSLTFSVSNPNTSAALSGVAFTDSLPAGLVVATPNNLSSTCGGTSTAVAGSGQASLSAGTLAANASCIVSLNVQGATGGVKNNSVQVTSTEGGTGNTSNASLTVTAPPLLTKAFGAASIPLAGSTSLSFTIQNSNAAQSLSGVGFTDTLPAGLTISTPNGLTGTCGGGTITAAQGASLVSLSGATLASSSSCAFAVNVTGVVAGVQSNTTSVVNSTEGGPGGTASANIAVVAPPAIAKAFGSTAIPLNGTTSLTLTVTNPVANAVAAVGVAFADTLPVGIVVATPNGLTSTCGGTATATAGSGSVSLAGGTIAAGSNCAVHLNVTGTTSGQFTNTTGAVSSTNGGTGNTATANLTVASPPTITKVFGAATIPSNGTTSLTFSVSNPNASVALTGIAFTDSLPAGLVVATPNNLSSTCGGTSAAVAGSGQASLSAGTVAANGTCTVSLNVQGATGGVKNNSVQVTSTEGGTGNTSNASLTVTAPPVISKAFGAASIPLNGAASLSFTIQNNNTAQSLSGLGFTDTLPAGLAISTPNGLTGACGSGTITAAQGTTAISLAGGTLASSGSCNFSVNVTGIAAGAQNNTTGAVTSTEGGTGGTASASITVVAPPSLAKAFGAAAIPLNGTTSLTFTVTNPVANTVAAAGVAFTDTLPVGIVVATPNGLTSTCGGTATATAGSGSVSLTGGMIAASSNCAVHINVTGTTSGQFTNTTGAVSSTNGGTGNTATANLTVAGPPTIAKAFGAATIPSNGTTTLTFNLTNPNANVALTALAFTDSLPAGLVVAPAPNLTDSCGGTAAATAGASSVSLASGTLAASASCTVSLNVQGTTPGVKNNSVQITSAEGGTGNTSNASLTVTAAPLLAKAFGAASIPLAGSTSLSFTIQNPNAAQSLSGVGFTDALPAGLVISTPNGLTGTCGGGAITATQSTSLISLSGATLASSSSCAFSVNVTGVAAGLQSNTTSVVSSTEGGPGATASANIAVVAPPAIAKAFNPAAIALGATSSLTFTITNPAANTVALAGVAFTDTLPTGLTLASSSAAVCGGTLTTSAPTGIALAGAAIAASGQCQFSVTVSGAVSGQYTNTTGAVSSTNGGAGNSATANLSVASPPAITKTFGAAKIALNGSTSLTFTLTSPAANTVPLTGVAFTDTLPAGLQISTPSGLTGSCGGGTITAAAGSSAISLAAATLAPGGSCTFAVNVTGTVVGAQNNSVTVNSTSAGAGNTSNASVTVVAPPTIQKSFGAASLVLGGSTSLTFVINNPNAASSVTGIGFVDALPAGLAVSTPNGLTGTCGGGTISSTAGSGSVSLAGATLAASASCSFAVNVTAIAGGTQNNVTGAIASTEGGSGLTAAASLTVVTPDLTITKSHAGNFMQGQAGATYTLTVTNQGAAATVGTVSVIDNLPATLTAVAFAGTGWTCTLTSLTCTRSDALGIGASYPPLVLTVNVSGVAPASVTNTAVVSGGGETNTSNDTASDVTTINVVAPDFSIAITPASDTVKAGMQAAYTITLTPLNNVPVSSPIVLSETGVPANSSPVFRPATVTPGSNAATGTFVISTTSGDPYLANNIGPRQSPRYAAWLPFAGLPLAGLLLSGAGFRKRVQLKRKIVLLCFVLGLTCCGIGLYGCASAGNFRKLGTPPGTYSVVVTGTLGNVQHSATVTLTVQP